MTSPKASFTTKNDEYYIVQGLKFSEYSQKKIDFATKKLIDERNYVDSLLK